MEKTGQYKGIFYNNKVSHHFYEGGAHFSYKALVKILEELKQDLNKERKNPSSTSSSPSKDAEQKKMKEIKKINMPLLSKQKNQSMECLINDNIKKIKADDIYSKIINDQFNKTKNTQMKILQKVKSVESNKYIKKIEKINKY